MMYCTKLAAKCRTSGALTAQWVGGFRKAAKLLRFSASGGCLLHSFFAVESCFLT
jgi:hypothetical protein